MHHDELHRNHGPKSVHASATAVSPLDSEWMQRNDDSLRQNFPGSFMLDVPEASLADDALKVPRPTKERP